MQCKYIFLIMASFPKKCIRNSFGYEFFGDAPVSFPVHNVAYSVGGIGESHQFNKVWICHFDFAAHGAGHKAVILTVNEKYGDTGLFYSLCCTCLFKVEAAKNESAETDERIDKRRWQVHVRTDGFDDICGG